jgi:DNA-binding beta-propeller fold protein YncE
MTDHYEPVLHVFDAETRQQILEITLPEVTTPDLSAAIGGTECSEGVACTPDGSLVLVCSNAGLQAVDTATDQVVRTLSDLRGNPGRVAVSFDGERAYVTCNPFSDSGGERRLVCIDL